jgi:hypothetical protein
VEAVLIPRPGADDAVVAHLPGFGRDPAVLAPVLRAGRVVALVGAAGPAFGRGCLGTLRELADAAEQELAPTQRGAIVVPPVEGLAG